jgi:hypothetical protein
LRPCIKEEAPEPMIEASHAELDVLAEQQAALRRVATLVARWVPPSEVFWDGDPSFQTWQGVNDSKEEIA